MKTIDLSEANVGDKFRTRNGRIMVYEQEVEEILGCYKLRCVDDDNLILNYNQFGHGYMAKEWELVEQVTDEPKTRFELPKLDEFDKMSKDLMQTLKSQLGGINMEQRFARRERIALTLLHIMGAEGVRDLIDNTPSQDNLKDLVDIVESVIGV